MAVKKVKISSVKRSQHLKAKKKVTKVTQKSSAKQSENKPLLNSTQQRKPKKKEKIKQKQPKKRFVEDSDEDPENIVENVRDVLDDEDLELLQNTPIKSKSRKRKYENAEVDNSEAKLLEKEYAKQALSDGNEKNKIVIDLLPIKGKDGEIITRTAKVDYKPRKIEEDENEDDDTESKDDKEDEDGEYEDSDEDIVQGDVSDEDEKTSTKVISTTDLLIRREQELEKQKYRIGIICSGILEKPEEKVKNFSALFELMDENTENGSPNLLSVRKIAIMSIAEVFKDILPEYRLGQLDTKAATVRKITLERVTYENALLQQFKKYLQKLEKITSQVTKKGGGKRTLHDIKLAETGINCLCDLLNAHPYFNYVQNIAQLLVYMLNCRYSSIRERINKCFCDFFASDKRLDMTLFIVRRINHLVKKQLNNVFVDLITCFMALPIKNINLDAEKENELKQKKLEAHRQRVLSLSKKERKRRKRLAELNKELQETKAEENKQSKHFKLTEITKMIFTIYFRVLKKDPNSKLLSACLEGLAEFAHVINLEFFSDLIEVLNDLLENGELEYREQLHCIQTIFVILSGQGEILNIDPIRFYGHLYRNLLVVNAGKNHRDFQIILRTLNEVLLKRRKNITQQRLLAFIKRIMTLSLQLQHNGTASCLGIVKNVMQLAVLDIILDTDCSLGSGRFNPELEDPEYCNATCTALYEVSLLIRHYHPVVRKLAQNIAAGVPTSGEGSLPLEIGKLTPEDLFTEYDSSKISFNPPIPPPKEKEPKVKATRQEISNDDLRKYCKNSVKRKLLTNGKLLNFYHEFSTK